MRIEGNGVRYEGTIEFNIILVGLILMKVKAIVHAAEEGGFWAEVPALPGCITEGDSIEEVTANLKDAIEGWLMVAEMRATTQSPMEETDRLVEIAL
jgi:predicted RNase H-like HicB family nuclease